MIEVLQNYNKMTNVETLASLLLPSLWSCCDLWAQKSRTGFEISYKGDGSVVTDADKDIELLLSEAIRKVDPLTPVVGEEALSDGRSDSHQGTYWLIDPIDGTSGMVDGTQEFAVCAALIEDHRPTLGLMVLPQFEEVYVGLVDLKQAWLYRRDYAPTQVQSRRAVGETPVVLHSRGESSLALRSIVAETARFVGMGSARKFVEIACGRADIYVRCSGLSEYDVAAGHALVLAAGANVVHLDGSPVKYGLRPGYYLPPFLISTEP